MLPSNALNIATRIKAKYLTVNTSALYSVPLMVDGFIIGICLGKKIKKKRTNRFEIQ